jgi:hypothetical protein
LEFFLVSKANLKAAVSFYTSAKRDNDLPSVGFYRGEHIQGLPERAKDVLPFFL